MISAEHIDLFQQANQAIQFHNALQAIAAGQNDAPSLARRALSAQPVVAKLG